MNIATNSFSNPPSDKNYKTCSFYFHLFNQGKIQAVVNYFTMHPVQRKMENKSIPNYSKVLLKLLHEEAKISKN